MKETERDSDDPMEHLTCEICGADILAKSGGIYTCTGCGMQYDRERIQEMATQCRQKTTEIEAPVQIAVESQFASSTVSQQKGKNYRKIITGIGIAAVGVVALLMIALPLLKEPKTRISVPAEKETVLEEVRNPVEEDIQGLWYYEDAEIGWHEEHYYCGGLVASLTWLDDAPEKASNDVGEYEVLDGQVRRRDLKTDYVTYLNYYYEGDELVLSWYIDSGRGAGSSRVYHKVSDSSSPKEFIPEKSDTITKSKNDDANVTNGMKNALSKAESYLQIMAFSRQGLIDQLEYDGFTYNEAVYAVDHCGADWFQQAAERAQSYLDIMSFSRQRLIDQLEYDGFSYDQAVYGVDKVY